VLYLLHRLQDETGWAALDALRSITFRAALAGLLAFVVSLLVGKPIIAWLRSGRLAERSGKHPSEKINELHRGKHDTPTMGGLMLLLAVLLSTTLFARLDNLFIQAALFVMLGLGVIGLLDDYLKQVRENHRGLSKMQKLGAQVLVSLPPVLALFAWAPSFMGSAEGANSYMSLQVPLVDATLPLGVGFLLWSVLVIVSSSNAVNLTDGLDGLASGCALLAGLCFGLLAYLAGRVDSSAHLGLLFVPGAGELAVFCAALVGATLGFLWFNCFPAEVFMGDTGSLPLGGVIGLVAVCVRQELLLLLVGGVFVVEAGSVILQVLSFRTSGRRIFACAPLHHHFQFRGWPESKVTIRFWILAAILALFSVATLKLG
jgi:phospho-N-acetylmuramoyl-pentapeptide-transferase